jgi:hypothetical protein
MKCVRAKSELFLIFIGLLILSYSFGNFVSAQPSSSGINWLQICRNPIVDTLVVEPCETLTSPDGYQLTDEGRKVLVCLLVFN